jgi:hypothetical protein
LAGIGRTAVQYFPNSRHPGSVGFADLERLIAHNAVPIVLWLDSFTYRVATPMSTPIHYDAETARRAVDGES